jgi:hypothetical protein
MYEKKVPQPTGPSRSRFVASSSNSGSRCGGGNDVDNACAPCGCPCGDSVYCTYDYYYGDVLHLPASIHLLFE